LLKNRKKKGYNFAKFGKNNNELPGKKRKIKAYRDLPLKRTLARTCTGGRMDPSLSTGRFSHGLRETVEPLDERHQGR
jgi:hypothetical protein